jgi:steroid delta-isomerase-like uncharacterized protein
MSTEANKALIRRFVEEVLNQKNLDAIDDICSPDFVEHDPLPGQGPGAEGLKQLFAQQFFPAFPDLRWTVKDMVAEGDYVMSRSTWTGTHKAAFLGIPATGKRVTVDAWTNDHVVDGRFTDSRILMNALSMLQQLGVIPEPS